MKITQSIFFLAAAMSLASCSSDDVLSNERVDAAHDAIVLRAGVSEGGVGVATRAIDDRHGQHVLFTQDTKLALQLNGKWNSNTVTQPTTGTTGTESATDSRHNNLALSPDLFWNDYGVADPGNTEGRAAGLTIYGAAVDGKTTLPTALAGLDKTATKWQTLAWTVGTAVTTEGITTVDQSEDWTAYDLLTSNNVTAGGDGTYKFDDFLTNAAGTSNIIEFTHAMAKVTVVLTAGEGFPEGKFENKPTVTLTAFKYTGSVSIPAKTSTPTEDKCNINMHLADGGAAHTATFDAIVYPGNVFTDATEILSLTADGNTFAITAKKINAAIQKAITEKATTGYPGTDNTFLQGWNYKILITVNKTSTHVTATIVDWNEVTAEEEAPKINVIETYGHVPGTNFAKGFDLYRSTSITGSYVGTGDHAVVSFADSKYTMSPQLYWPNHQTHYFFRGVWPLVGSAEGPTAAQVNANSIAVANEAYTSGHYPSDLMIGRPLITDETATDEACKVHSGTQGICATEGDVRMNFRYMMSQVKVELSSSNPTDKDYIAFDANTRVELIGGYTDGAILLSSCTADFTGKTVAPYTLHNAAADDYDSYHDAIIPQALTAGLKFRITVTNDNGTTDVYECAVKDIKVSENSATPALISAWQSGKIYTYRLKVTKTAVNVTATLTDWVNVEASENVWF